MMSDLNARLRQLASQKKHQPLLTNRVPLRALRSFLLGELTAAPLAAGEPKSSNSAAGKSATGQQTADKRAAEKHAADRHAMQRAGYLDESGAETQAGSFLRAVTSDADAVVLTLQWQHSAGVRELQMWLDQDLVLLVETRSVRGSTGPTEELVEESHALIGYASYLDLMHVMSRWLNIVPTEVAPVPDRDLAIADVAALAHNAEPSGLGSLSVGTTPLVDFVREGDRYFLLLPAECKNDPGLIAASLTSWNLLTLLTATVLSGGVSGRE